MSNNEEKNSKIIKSIIIIFLIISLIGISYKFIFKNENSQSNQNVTSPNKSDNDNSNNDKNTNDNKNNETNNDNDNDDNNSVNSDSYNNPASNSILHSSDNNSNSNPSMDKDKDSGDDIINPKPIPKPPILEPEEPKEPDDLDIPSEPDEPEDQEEPKITVPDTKYQGLTFPQITPTDKKVTYTEFQISNKKQVERGITGNNSQWITQFETSKDGELMLFSEDVSGMFKSTDHGLTWKRANSGITSPGVGMFAIDPHNNNHVLALGLSSREYIGSIFISNDGAESWKKSCFYEGESKPCNGTSSNGARYQYDGLEFDPTSYDETKKQSMVAYYSTPFLRDNELTHNKTNDGKPPIDKETFATSETKYYKLMRLTDTTDQENKKNKMGLYISTDGGNTFEMFIKDVKLSDGMVKILDNGSLYVGNEYGLFKIDKVNKTIEQEYLLNTTDQTSKGITGLDSVGNTLYVQTWEGIYKLDDKTQVMTKITDDTTYKTSWPRSIEVSLTNPNHMLMTYRTSVTNYYSNTLTYSLDGGKTWTDSEIDLNTTYYTANSWRSREKMIVIDSTNDKNVLTTGGDYIAHSEDYGAHFVQSSGVTHTMQGGKFNFNYYQPDLLFLSAQDYTGNITFDGAYSFKDVVIKDTENNNLGNVYGGFAADDLTWYGFVKQTWCGGNLMVTHNGGDTWIDTGLTSEVHKCSFYSSLQSPTNPDILFANEYYSKDRGYTWQKMKGAISVFTYNVTGKHELYGTNSEGNIVVSYDNGDTWKIVSTVTWTEDNLYDKLTGKAKYGETIVDLAYDHINNIFYVIGMTFTSTDRNNGDRTFLYKYDANTGVKTKITLSKKDSTMRFKTVAVDPNSTAVIYVGGSGDYFSAVDSLQRSVDGGKTWRVLTTHNDPTITSWATNQGGYEISNIRVDPYTGYVLMSAGCNGYFLIDPPYDTNLLKHSAPQEHIIKYVYNGEVKETKTIKNNAIQNYELSIDGLKFAGWYLDEELTIPYKNGQYVYESMILYAKMTESKKVTFYENDKVIKTLDVDKYSETMDDLILKREGYAFAGWYTDKTLTTKVDFNNIDSDIKVYAGFYKIACNIYNNDTIRDVNSALSYITQMTESLGTYYTNDIKLNNRSNLLTLELGKNYYIMMKMDNRFRLGFFPQKEASYKSVENYWIHPYDTNSKLEHLGANVSYLLEDNQYKRLMLYYYTLNDEVNFLDVKNTIRVYELIDTTLYL